MGAPSFFSIFRKKSNEQAKFEREPDRTSLTQPPPGYQTPSPNYPYGIGADQGKTTAQMPQVQDRAASNNGNR